MASIRQLMAAPAVLGLLTPNAAAAAELNLERVNHYARSQEQVTSISQFTDLRPSDWAYQALSNLVERYGCVAGYPNGTFRGGQAMTRFEAAALLNAQPMGFYAPAQLVRDAREHKVEVRTEITPLGAADKPDLSRPVNLLR